VYKNKSLNFIANIDLKVMLSSSYQFKQLEEKQASQVLLSFLASFPYFEKIMVGS
jgi:hypothetical protein